MCTAQSRYILIKYLSESGSSAKKRLVRVIHKTNILTQDSHPETNVGTEQKYLQDQYQPNAAPENKDLSSVKSMLPTSRGLCLKLSPHFDLANFQAACLIPYIFGSIALCRNIIQENNYTRTF